MLMKSKNYIPVSYTVNNIVQENFNISSVLQYIAWLVKMQD